MKYIVLFSFLFVWSTFVSAQTPETKVLDFAEEMPEYPGGVDEFRKEIGQLFQLPANFEQNGGQDGHVIARFVVEPNGAIGQVKILNNNTNCKACEKSTIDAIKNVKHKFSPGKQDGVAVPVWFTFPINITLAPELPNLANELINEAPNKTYLNSLINEQIVAVVDGQQVPKYDIAELDEKEITRLTVLPFFDQSIGRGHVVYIELNNGEQFSSKQKRLGKLKKEDFNKLYMFNNTNDLIVAPPPPPPPPPPAKQSERRQTLDFAEKMPEYPGGIKGLRKELEKNIILPRSVSKQFSGTENIVLRFVVLEDGSTGEVRILRGIKGCDRCGEAAVEAVKSLSKKFIPGEQAGKKVKIWFTVPFKINFE